MYWTIYLDIDAGNYDCQEIILRMVYAIDEDAAHEFGHKVAYQLGFKPSSVTVYQLEVTQGSNKSHTI